jgi:hypothetical protein
MCTSSSEDPNVKIVAAVQERWQAQRSPYLLSQLGKDFAAEVAAISAGRRLKQIIEEDFATTLKPVFDRVRLWGVVPAGEVAPESGEVPTGARASAPKFQLPVWAAFRKAPPPGSRRFLVRHGESYQFTDPPATDPPPQDTIFEIPHDKICAAEMPSHQVAEQIRAFIEGSGLPLNDYLVKPLTQAPEASGSRAKERPRRSVLDMLIGALSPADQRRVALSLDVVAKLQHHLIDQ